MNIDNLTRVPAKYSASSQVPARDFLICTQPPNDLRAPVRHPRPQARPSSDATFRESPQPPRPRYPQKFFRRYTDEKSTVYKAIQAHKLIGALGYTPVAPTIHGAIQERICALEFEKTEHVFG